MTGTFGGALEARGIPAGGGRLRSTTMGEIEDDDGVLVIRRIRVTYHVAIDPDTDTDKLDRAFRVHPSRCPVYRSIHPQIEVTTDLQLDSAGEATR